MMISDSRIFQVDYEGGESGLGSPGIRPEEPLPVAGIDDDYETGTMITYGTANSPTPISKSNIPVSADKVGDEDEEDQLSSPQLWQLPELEEDLDVGGTGGGLTGLATNA